MDRDETSYLAGEFALGLLDDGERERVLRLMDSDAELRAEVIFWQESLAGMTPDVRAQPSRDVKRRLQAELFGDGPRTLWQEMVAPENRGLVLVVAIIKVSVIAGLLWFVLAG